MPDTVLSPDTSSVYYQNRKDYDSPATSHLGGGNIWEATRKQMRSFKIVVSAFKEINGEWSKRLQEAL